MQKNKNNKTKHNKAKRSLEEKSYENNLAKLSDVHDLL